MEALPAKPIEAHWREATGATQPAGNIAKGPVLQQAPALLLLGAQEPLMTIQELLQQRDLTQADLARQTGLGESYISRIISGDREVPPVIATYRKLASTLGVSLDELISILESNEQE